MRLILTGNVFDVKNHIALAGLIHRGLSKRCYIEVSETDSELYRLWAESQDRRTLTTWHTLLDWSLRDQAYFRSQPVIVDDSQADDWTVSPPRANLSTAIHVVDAPFHILLENGRYDSAFLFAMATPAQRDLIVRLVEQHRIILDGSGGIGELRKRVEDQISAYPYRSVRFWALFDSDAAVPGSLSTEATLTQRACSAANIPHHVLARRAIENYLPKGALYDWANDNRRDAKERRARVDAFYRLSSIQRAHFHLKAGFTDLSAEPERSLFAGVKDADRATLSGGVGKKIAELYGSMDIDRMREFVEKEGCDHELRPSIAQLVEMLRVPNG